MSTLATRKLFVNYYNDDKKNKRPSIPFHLVITKRIIALTLAYCGKKQHEKVTPRPPSAPTRTKNQARFIVFVYASVAIFFYRKFSN